MNERTNEQTNELTNERTNERMKIVFNTLFSIQIWMN